MQYVSNNQHLIANDYNAYSIEPTNSQQNDGSNTIRYVNNSFITPSQYMAEVNWEKSLAEQSEILFDSINKYSPNLLISICVILKCTNLLELSENAGIHLQLIINDNIVKEYEYKIPKQQIRFVYPICECIHTDCYVETIKVNATTTNQSDASIIYLAGGALHNNRYFWRNVIVY